MGESRESQPSYFATASLGTEQVLAEELAELGIEAVRADRGGVAFGRTLEEIYRACLWSRVASRILLPLARFDAPDAGALYEGARTIDWTEHIGPERTLAVSVAGADAPAGPSHFIALKVKDAIVDVVREKEGARPDIDKHLPDLRVHVHVRGPRTTLSLDFAGRGLHHRGFERAGAVAPLRENLAAALLRIAGWPRLAGTTPLLDPMCGSGTLLAEAAGMALDLAPGLARERLGAEGWRGHDHAMWERLRAEARERRAASRGRKIRIAGTDASSAAVSGARRIVRVAGLAEQVRIETGELRDARPPWDGAGLIVTNPPYGERLGEAGELGPLYELLGDVLKRRFPGWTAWVLSGNRSLDKRIGLRPASRRPLFNGPIACRFLEFPIASTPVASDRGPGWRRPGKEARGFKKRLQANARRLKGWASRERLNCYRLYDSDIPEYNLAVDWFDGTVRVQEHPRPAKVATEDAERRLRDAMAVVSEVLGVESADVVLQVSGRDRRPASSSRRGGRGALCELRDGDLSFRVSPTDDPDPALLLETRLLRRRIGKLAVGRDFLDLLAGTCTFSVAAAAGGARSTTSVEPSGHGLERGRLHFEINGVTAPAHRFIRASVEEFMRNRKLSRRYDLVVVRPRLRSSRGVDAAAGEDHARLLGHAARLLADGGEIVLATTLRDPDLRGMAPRGFAMSEFTDRVTSPDFARRPRLRAWSLHRA